MSQPPKPAGPALERVVDAAGNRAYRLSGAWNLRALESRVGELTPQLAAWAAESGAGRGGEWDLRAVEVMDMAGAAVLWRAWGNRRAPRLALSGEQDKIFKRLELPAEPAAAAPAHDPLQGVAWMGRRVLLLLEHLMGVLDIIGHALADIAAVARHPSHMPWREVSANIYRTGAQALGITALVGFLIGVVLSYLSAQQLKLFGAEAYIINILGISVIRELGPVLAAVLVAGRSGSAITAQLGVMRVTEELDAMAVMGIPHALRLILPRMAALAVSMPLIVLWTSGVAMIGGIMAADLELGIGYQYFISSLPDAVPVANLWLGLGKGAVFGVLIALVACHFGLRIEPNTESLGEGTTRSVVTSITVVIIVDAVFAILFKDVGIS